MLSRMRRLASLLIIIPLSVAGFTIQYPIQLFRNPLRSNNDISKPAMPMLLHLSVVNGEKEFPNTISPEDVLMANSSSTIDKLNATELLPTAPAVTYKKFITMQDKRVVVTIRYSGEAGLRPYFLTVAKKLKQSHPDVIVERRILPAASVDSDGIGGGWDGEATFEILVDGTVVVGKAKARRAKVARVDMTKSRSVYVSMQELDVAIARARRRRRPSTVYGDVAAAQSSAMRKELLREQGGAEEKDDVFS